MAISSLIRFAKLVAVHPGHHHVTDYNIRDMASDQLKGFHPVSGDNYPFEVSFERSFQKVCHIRIVIHYENCVWSGIEYFFFTDGSPLFSSIINSFR